MTKQILLFLAVVGTAPAFNQENTGIWSLKQAWGRAQYSQCESRGQA